MFKKLIELSGINISAKKIFEVLLNNRALIIYILLSYLVAIVSITVIQFNNIDIPSNTKFKNTINILLSTNACFIITTGYGIKTSLQNINNNYLLAYYFIGLVICGTFNATSLLDTNFPNGLYIFILIITTIICYMIAKVYIESDEKVDKIIRENGVKEMYLKAKDIIKQTENMEEFGMDGSTFTI